MNNIFVYYLPFSGGRFISNCLALSKNVVVNDRPLALEDLSFDAYDADYYQFKLESVLQSFPTDITQGQPWTEFPIFDDSIYDRVLEKNKIVCRIAHWKKLENFQEDHSLPYLTNLYGTAPIIKLEC